jgi:hypothetical protein
VQVERHRKAACQLLAGFFTANAEQIYDAAYNGQPPRKGQQQASQGNDRYG